MVVIAVRITLAVVFLHSLVSAQSVTQSPDVMATVAELRQMVQTLQQQVAAVHSTLLTQQTMSIDEVCQTITTNLGGSKSAPSKDCTDIKNLGNKNSGVYTIQPPGEPTGRQVYCEMAADGEAWTVIQRRFDGSQDFYRTYAEYEAGFGNVTGEYYLGNKLIHQITSSGKYEVLVELEDFQQVVKTEHYAEFSVGDSPSKYQLHVAGPNGTAGDSLMFDHDGNMFSTHDSDNDAANNVNCAEKHHGGYWYSSCFKSNINGQWGVPGEKGIIWGSFKDWNMYVLKRTEMKIRRISS